MIRRIAMANGMSNLYGLGDYFGKTDTTSGRPMWDDLPLDTRQSMTDAGMTPDSYFMADDASVKPFLSQDAALSGMSGKDMIGAGLGIGQLGLGIAGYLDNKKTAKLQRQNLGTQIASNKDLLTNRKARRADIGSAFGTKPGLGV